MTPARPVPYPAHLREANGRLVVATLQARTQAEQAEQAIEELAYRTRLEARLLVAQKQEALGMLASGVAHDFNNLLTTIIGNVDMGTLASQPESQAALCFAAIHRAAMKAAELTRQLLAYTGRGSTIEAEVDLGVVVKEIAELLAISIPANVVLNCQLQDRLPWVKGDPTQIFQVLMNLIGNAIQAFPAGMDGRITVCAHPERVDEAIPASAAWILPVAPGPYATLEVTDNGIGMTPEVLARAFEPFFSTKSTGHGLGLAAVLGILRSHGGGLRVESRPGSGTSFKVFLPAMRTPRAGALASASTTRRVRCAAVPG